MGVVTVLSTMTGNRLLVWTTAMNLHPQETPSAGEKPPAMALFALGFRPFFLLAMASAVLLLTPWAFAYRGVLALDTYYGGVAWHAHEMIFGYTMAVIAGFLLTAVGRWTGTETLTGGRLAALALLWVLGRLLPFFHHAIPIWIVAAVDLAFLPLLALSVAYPLAKSPGRNLIFVPVLLTLSVANVLTHAGHWAAGPSTERIGMNLGINVVVLLITLIGGRVFPFFTQNALPGSTPRSRKWLEPIAIGSVIAFASIQPFSPPPALLGIIAAVAAAANAMRLIGWFERRVVSQPMLWVLYLGYAWLIIGFALTALTTTGRVSPFIALHAFTTGAIGVTTLGMMTRVALGHTGRPIKPARSTVLAFIALNLSAAMRVFAPIVAPERIADFVATSAILWIVAFVLALSVYADILIRPRVDGRPG